MALCLQLDKLKRSLIFAIFASSLARSNVNAIPALTKVVVDVRNCSLGNQLLYQLKIQSGLE